MLIKQIDLSLSTLKLLRVLRVLLEAKTMTATAKELNIISSSVQEVFCSICSGTGWQRFPNLEGHSIVRRCVGQAHLTQRVLGCGVPAVYQHFSFSNYNSHNSIESQAKRRLQSLTKTISLTKTGAILSSKNPNGKTHLAVALVQALLLENKLQPRFFDTTDLVRQLDKELNLIPEFQRRLLSENVNKVELLVLDDFGNGSYSQIQQEELEYIINYRHRNILPIIITTRLTDKELEQFLSPSIYSRLQEMCEVISLDTV